jgi:hypothetical protein
MGDQKNRRHISIELEKDYRVRERNKETTDYLFYWNRHDVRVNSIRRLEGRMR